MKKLIALIGILAFCFSLIQVSVFAKPKPATDYDVPLEIDRTVVDVNYEYIHIYGNNFGENPAVVLNNTSLFVIQFDNTYIKASLEEVMPPATYKLIVSNDGQFQNLNLTDTLDLTIGTQGPAGPEGSVGPQGEQGVAGPQGDIGATGSQGPAGAMGPRGDTGLRGLTGNTGPQGIPGLQGDTGSQGVPGLGAVEVYDGADQYLGLLMGKSSINLDIFMPSIQLFLSLSTRDGSVFPSGGHFYYKNRDCTGDAYMILSTTSSVHPTGHLLDAGEQPVSPSGGGLWRVDIIGEMIEGDSDPNRIQSLWRGDRCDTSSPSTGTYYIVKVTPVLPENLTFSLPITLPLRFETDQ